MKPPVVAATPDIPSALSARPVSRGCGRYHGIASDVSDAGMKPSSARMLGTIVPRVLPNAVHMSIYYIENIHHPWDSSCNRKGVIARA